MGNELEVKSKQFINKSLYYSFYKDRKERINDFQIDMSGFDSFFLKTDFDNEIEDPLYEIEFPKSLEKEFIHFIMFRPRPKEDIYIILDYHYYVYAGNKQDYISNTKRLFENYKIEYERKFKGGELNVSEEEILDDLGNEIYYQKAEQRRTYIMDWVTLKESELNKEGFLSGIEDERGFSTTPLFKKADFLRLAYALIHAKWVKSEPENVFIAKFALFLGMDIKNLYQDANSAFGGEKELLNCFKVLNDAVLRRQNGERLK